MTGTSFSQIPYHHQYTEKDLMQIGMANIPFIELPSFNVQEDMRKSSANKCSNRLKPFHFAKTFDVNYHIHNSGVWDTLDNGNKVWYIGFTSTGAYSLNMIFNKYKLPKGGKVYIYNPDKTTVLGGFTHQNNKKSGILPISPIPGDSVIIEYHVPYNVKVAGKLQVKTIGHDYKNIIKILNLKDGNFGSSGNCNVDINCPVADPWQEVKNSVCRIIYGGNELCSGTLLNNTGYDSKPYILTANHCLHNESSANSAIFFFNYESPVCDGPDGSISKTLAGATLKATAGDLDFALVLASDNLPLSYNPYFAGWDARVLSGGTLPPNTVCIHHPNGDVKKIAIDDDSPSTASYGSGYASFSHWLIHNWELGTTEKGSSGSPLFSDKQRVIGDLTGGEAECADPVNDYFAKFSRSWDDYSNQNQQLKHWLDPVNTGAEYVDGYNPITSLCDTINNIRKDDSLVVYTQNNEYITGHSSALYTQFAEYIEIAGEKNYIAGALLKIARSHTGGQLSRITVKIWDDGAYPGDVIVSKDVYLSNINENAYYFVSFDTVHRLNNNFYIGYQVYYANPDTFAIYQTLDRTDTLNNSAFIFKNFIWSNYKDIFDLNTSLDISAVGCNSFKANINTPLETKDDAPLLYPNPASDHLYVIPSGGQQINSVSIYDLAGKKIDEFKISHSLRQAIYLDVNHVNPGIYIAKLSTDKQTITKKIIITD
jgi:hypothetical protein